MKEIAGNVWSWHEAGSWVAITTNGTIRKDGACVMGRGVALQARRRFPRLPYELGADTREHGTRVFAFPQYRLYTFPVKHNWWEKADLNLIVSSCHQLVAITPPGQVVYLVRPGCGNGGLSWNVVQPVIAPILDGRFVVVQFPLKIDNLLQCFAG